MPNYRLEKGSVQEGFYKSRAKIQIFGGGFGNGKTTAAVIKALGLCKDFPGSRGLLARATYPKLNDTLRYEFLRWCPPNWIVKRPTQEDNSVYMVNGTAVNFRYIAQRGKTREDGSTSSNLLSATYDWIVVDQMEDPEIAYKDFLDLLGRLRGSTPYRPDVEDPTMPSEGPRWFVMTMNPSHNWAYREVVQPYITWRDKGIRMDKLIVDASTGQPLIELFESATYDNKANLGEDYIRTLEAAYKGQMRERYLEGKWAAFEGLVHPGFDAHVHCLTRKDALDHLDRCLSRHVKVKAVEGYDFGIVSPSCYMLAYADDKGRVIVIDGFYEKEFSYDQHPQAIFNIRSKYTGRLSFTDPINADPAIFRRQIIAGRKDTGDTLARLLGAEGLYLRPASNDVVQGISKVNSYMASWPKIAHVVTAAKPAPLFYIVDDLAWFQDEISSYYWKRNPQGMNIDEPIDHNDHAMDTTKYLLAHLPKPSEIIIPQDKLPPQWSFWHEVDINEADAMQRAM
jgi:hypothetical protein